MKLEIERCVPIVNPGTTVCQDFSLNAPEEHIKMKNLVTNVKNVQNKEVVMEKVLLNI